MLKRICTGVSNTDFIDLCMVIDKINKEPESSIISQIKPFVDDSSEKADILVKLLKVVQLFHFPAVV